MGLGRLLNRSTQYQATDTVTGATSVFTVVDGLAPDWPTYSYQGAMGIPGAWRAATLLSDLLGQIPWDAYRKVPQPGDVPPIEILIEPRPMLLEQPTPPDTRMSTFGSMALDLIWHGNALNVIASRDARGVPNGIIPVPANNVSVRRVTPFASSPLPVGALEYKIGTLTLGSSDVIHIKGPCEPGAVRGLGVLETQLNTISLAREQQRQASGLATNGIPTGILKVDNPDLQEDEATKLKANWLRSQSTRSVAVLNANTEFQPLSWNPEEMQLIEARKFSLTELELVFGFPPGWLGGDAGSNTYRNDEQSGINLLKFGLGGHLARFEQTLSLAYPRGTVVRADTDVILRGDTLSRFQSYAIGINSNFLTPDEARAADKRRPLTPEQRSQLAELAAAGGGQAGNGDRSPGNQPTNRDGRPAAPGTPGAPSRRPLSAVPNRKIG